MRKSQTTEPAKGSKNRKPRAKANAKVQEAPEAAPLVDYNQWKAEKLAAIEAGVKTGDLGAQLQGVAEMLLEMVERDAFAGAYQSEPGTVYAAIMAALDVCRTCCDELEHDAHQWLAREVRLHRAYLAKFEASGLMPLADSITPEWDMRV